jgi:phosphonate transport system ATP-binding protein
VSSLDPSRSDEIVVLLADVVAGGRALVVSLHDFGIARRRCDRLIGLRHGRIVFDLPASQVTDQHGLDLYRIGS